MKQRNGKSLNLQCNNCNKVSVSDLKQTISKVSGSDAEKSESYRILENLLLKKEDGMLTLTFQKLHTAKNSEAEDFARSYFDANVIRSMVWGIVPDVEIFNKLPQLKYLACLVQDWKKTRCVFRGQEIPPYELVSFLAIIKRC